VWNGLYFSRSSKTPATEPTTGNILRPIHLLLHFGIFCETYISTGKYTVRGQNPNAHSHEVNYYGSICSVHEPIWVIETTPVSRFPGASSPKAAYPMQPYSM